ncbi:hypothetical protein GCM10010467_20280 [Actinocorallia glomerata]|uniref:Uncharacterized protein n=2 Tax=Actinomycetes TaxID=1760 RepID=A0ABP6LW16_9MICC
MLAGLALLIGRDVVELVVRELAHGVAILRLCADCGRTVRRTGEPGPLVASELNISKLVIAELLISTVTGGRPEPAAARRVGGAGA